MIIILLTVSIISVLTEACETPRCTIQNTKKGYCYVDKKDKHMIQPYTYNRKISVKFYNVTTESNHTNSNANIQINIGKGSKQNLRYIAIEVKKNNLPWIYVVNIQKKEVRKNKELLVFLSCLQMSTSASRSNISVALGMEPSKKQTRKKKNHTNRNSRDVSEIGTISSQHSMTKTKENEPKENKMKRSAQGSGKNCIVNITSKTIMFWWPKKENKQVYRCGLMDSGGNLTIGKMTEIDKTAYCVTRFNKDEHYYSRMFFYDWGKNYASPCNVSVDMKTLESHKRIEKNCIVNITSKTITFSWLNKGNKKVYSCGLMDSDANLTTGKMTEIDKTVYCVTRFNKDEHYYSRIFFYDWKKNYASPCNVSVDMRTLESHKPNEGDSAPVDSTLVAVLVILFTAMCILFVFIICLLWSRRKLQKIMKVDDKQYQSQNRSFNVSSDPKAMIVSVNEFENGIPQLVSLLEGAKINVLTVASNVKENMLSQHDWLEKTVSECNHFIFIVTKQMGEVLKRMITDHPKQSESDSSIECEGETCAYVIALIRNKFIKSLKYDGYCVNSCHLVSFEENYCDGILRSNQGRELFPCIKTHSYNLYLKERFQFGHACRIINNIKRSEKSKARKVRQLTPSQTWKHPKESMDIENAFVSMIPSTNCNFVPVSQTESNENDSDIDIDVTSDLLGYEMSC